MLFRPVNFAVASLDRTVQLAGKKNPFTVTVILACAQPISVLLVCTTTDQFGRRPLTVYSYMITVISVLGLGIVGCFDYTSGEARVALGM